MRKQVLAAVAIIIVLVFVIYLFNTPKGKEAVPAEDELIEKIDDETSVEALTGAEKPSADPEEKEEAEDEEPLVSPEPVQVDDDFEFSEELTENQAAGGLAPGNAAASPGQASPMENPGVTVQSGGSGAGTADSPLNVEEDVTE